jgi:hypothetical protein
MVVNAGTGEIRGAALRPRSYVEQEQLMAVATRAIPS